MSRLKILYDNQYLYLRYKKHSVQRNKRSSLNFKNHEK